MDQSEIEYFAAVFRALADPTRQRILELLRESDELTVTQIASNFDFAQPTISQHLRVLKQVEAVKVRSAGQQRYYRLCNVRMYDAMEQFMLTYEAESKASDE
ncbi:ArsR/SmtB family transcription factor [Humibacter antri]